MDYTKVIAKNLKRIIYESGKSQDEVAKYVGVSRTSVTNWCSGTRTPKMDKIDKMCELFGCRRSDIMEEHTATPHDILQSDMLDLIEVAKECTVEEIRMATDQLKRLQAYRRSLNDAESN